MMKKKSKNKLTAPKKPAGPGIIRGLAVLLGLLLLVTWLVLRVDDGKDENVSKLGKIEVTAKLLDCPDKFPDLGAYKYTYVVKYEVKKIHRQDPAGKYLLKPGDIIFVGHYKPLLPRAEIKDDEWGDAPLGGKLVRIVRGDTHRLALDYELSNLAPCGVLDFFYPAGVNRFFAVWVNPTGL